MTSPLELELHQHAAALRRLARGLVGDSFADDLVQDAVLEALQAKPAPRSWGAWLATVLRFRAHKHRRAERRRAGSEAQVLREPAPAADQPLEHEEMLRGLTDAVLGLPQPYRQVVLLRYLQECSPAEIAARLGAPLATVKSQLQRGLAMLRTALAARTPGRDWRGALLAAFALERAPVAPVVVGGLFMAVGSKWVVGGAVLSLAVIAFAWRGEAWLSPQPAPTRSADAGSAALAGAPNRDAGADDERTVVAAANELAEPWAEVRGRCIDPAGEPLPGITASLHSDSRPESDAASVVTGTDGRFAVRRAAPAEWQFDLTLVAEGRCTSTHRLRGKVGAVLDVGDVTILPAIRVGGTLRNRRGEPVAAATLQLGHTTIDSDGRMRVYEELRTDAGGRFGPSIGLPPGRGRITGASCHLAGNAVEFALDAAQPLVELELVAVDRSELPGIAGVVVDEAGVPIAGASVYLLGDTVSTAPDGTFRVVCGDVAFGPGPFQLQAWVESDHETAWGGPFELGCTDARIVIHRLRRITVHVRRADDQQPVEVYGALLWRQAHASRPLTSEVESHPRGRSVHEVARGTYVVTIVPDDANLMTATSEPFVVEHDTAIHIELAAAGRRVLALADASGRPLEGIGVELLQENGRAITPDANAVDFRDTKYIEPTSPVRLMHGTTDAGGELLLHGPNGRPLALRLTGPGPVQSIVQPVFLDPPGRLEHRMPPRASFRGRLVPDDVVQDFMRASGGRFGLAVHVGGVPRYALTGPRIAIAPDGTFESELPSGRWNFTVVCGTATLPLGAIEVQAGGPMSEIPIAALRRSDVELQLCVDGSPLAFGSVQCVVGNGPFHWMETQQADQHGRVKVRMFPGVLTAAVRLPPGGGLSELMVWPAEGATVPPGASLALTIDVHPVAIEIAVRTPAGHPAVDVPLRLAGTGVRGPDLQPSDGAGIARAGRVDAGRYTILTVPRSLGSDLTVIPRDAWFAIGSIDVRAANRRVELTLPRAWDR